MRIHKTLLKITGANHNDLFIKGLKEYIKAIKILSEKTAKNTTG